MIFPETTIVNHCHIKYSINRDTEENTVDRVNTQSVVTGQNMRMTTHRELNNWGWSREVKQRDIQR